ncbi:MAG TPA: hypothetical protein VKY89_18975 [Thermoanaerobaculia bacterium]|jgi:hypothetical protein|nr:hypothetical protein [Thermoanaerobaculia bacterium]
MRPLVACFAAWVLAAGTAGTAGAASASGAAGAAESDRDLLSFLVGSYDFVGRQHDGGATYSGTLEVSGDGGRLRLVRTVAGARSTGTARVEPRTPDKIKVLVASFAHAGEQLEAWCIIGSDLDNYPRLTCLVRPHGKPAGAPGLEAWFHRPPP